MTEPASILENAPAGYWGTVLGVQANYYWVQLDNPQALARMEGLGGASGLPEKLLCTRRARLKKMGQQVMVGDRVLVEQPDWQGERGAIAQVATRRTLLDRPPIANADQVLLVFALAEPDLDPHQLSRFLVKAESTGLSVCLCLNKQDLVEPETSQAWVRRLQQWGYDPISISVQAEASWLVLSQRLRNHITVVSGPSGVGKSSLINRLIPQADLRTGAVSGKLGRGRHTTRHVELFELPEGGFLADTPGFNQPDVPATPEVLGSYFPEIRERLRVQPCQFADCLHRDEPGCGVGEAWERYQDYRDLLEEAIARQEALAHQRDPEAAFKVKTTGAGQVQHEPRLQAKKYRRISRKTRKQALQDLCVEMTDSLEDLDNLDDLSF